MLEFQLFRIKVFPSRQTQLFGEPLSARELVRRAVEGRPTTELRRGVTWHIGNVKSELLAVVLGAQWMLLAQWEIKRACKPKAARKDGDAADSSEV